jgi:hypothetical protein
MHLPGLPALAPRHAALLALAAAVAAACGGDARPERGAKASSAAAPCRAGVEEAVALAAADYIKTVKPKPERFLVSVGTDSALGDAGMTMLQDKGPTYLFPGDPSLQTQVRSLLHEKGDYTTLLVVRRSARAQNGRAEVTLSGHYVGGEDEGKTPGPRSYVFGCDTTGWRITTASAERST